MRGDMTLKRWPILTGLERQSPPPGWLPHFPAQSLSYLVSYQYWKTESEAVAKSRDQRDHRSLQKVGVHGSSKFGRIPDLTTCSYHCRYAEPTRGHQSRNRGVANQSHSGVLRSQQLVPGHAAGNRDHHFRQAPLLCVPVGKTSCL